MEVRLYAEDPYRGFVPSPGPVRLLRWPEGPGVRVDSGVYEGSEITIHYDPMLAKLTVWGSDRATALERLSRALHELRVEGIRTSVPLFRSLLKDEDFLSGRLDIGMLDRKLEAGELRPDETEELEELPILAAAIAYLERSARRAAVSRPSGGSRGHWKDAGRREGRRGGTWNS